MWALFFVSRHTLLSNTERRRGRAAETTIIRKSLHILPCVVAAKDFNHALRLAQRVAPRVAAFL